MIVPKRRTSRARKNKRRSHHALKAKHPTMCPLTGLPKQHHRACGESGYVRPGLVIRVPKLGIGTE